jgi:hypothetical protein
MSLLLAIAAPIIVLILGYTLLPIVGAFVIHMPLLMIIRPLSRFWSYMISRYGGFVIEGALFGAALHWSLSQLNVVAWPAWIAFAWIMLVTFNTLYQFDIMCSQTQSGAWSPTMRGSG